MAKSGSVWTGAPGQGSYQDWVTAQAAKPAAKPTAEQTLLASSRDAGGGGIPHYAEALAGAIKGGISDLGAASVTPPVATLTPEQARANLEASKAAQAKQQQSQTTQAAAGPSVQDLLSAILGGSRGEVPKGYADFFTSVLGPLMAQASQLPSTPLPQADLNAMTPQDRQAFDKAYGQQTGALEGMLKGNQLATLAAPGLQEFVTGPLGNYQKLIQQLQNALSFIPYSAQGIASMPVQAGSVLAQLGINPSALGVGAAVPGATPGAAPSLSPGALVTAGG